MGDFLRKDNKSAMFLTSPTLDRFDNHRAANLDKGIHKMGLFLDFEIGLGLLPGGEETIFYGINRRDTNTKMKVDCFNRNNMVLSEEKERERRFADISNIIVKTRFLFDLDDEKGV